MDTKFRLAAQQELVIYLSEKAVFMFCVTTVYVIVMQSTMFLPHLYVGANIEAHVMKSKKTGDVTFTTSNSIS